MFYWKGIVYSEEQSSDADVEPASGFFLRVGLESPQAIACGYFYSIPFRVEKSSR